MYSLNYQNFKTLYLYPYKFLNNDYKLFETAL